MIDLHKKFDLIHMVRYQKLSSGNHACVNFIIFFCYDVDDAAIAWIEKKYSFFGNHTLNHNPLEKSRVKTVYICAIVLKQLEI
jgi:hypothetical protein